MGNFGSQSILGNLEAPWTVLRFSIAPPPAPSTQRGPWRPPQWTNAPPQTSLAVMTTTTGSGTTNYYFDAVLRLLHQQPAVATQHPTQSGAPITDHMYLLPARVELSVAGMRWVAVHTAYEKNRLFVDEQEIGPFAAWVHRHEFIEDRGRTRLTDRVEYRLKGGRPLEVAIGWAVRAALERMFRHRHKVTREICEGKRK